MDVEGAAESRADEMDVDMEPSSPDRVGRVAEESSSSRQVPRAGDASAGGAIDVHGVRRTNDRRARWTGKDAYLAAAREAHETTVEKWEARSDVWNLHAASARLQSARGLQPLPSRPVAPEGVQKTEPDDQELPVYWVMRKNYVTMEIGTLVGLVVYHFFGNRLFTV